MAKKLFPKIKIRDLQQLGRQRQEKRRFENEFIFLMEFREWLNVFTISYGGAS